MSEWKWVPVEPTEDMLRNTRIHFYKAEGIYKAMLAATPTPDVEPVAWVCGHTELVKAARALVDAHNKALPFRPDNLDHLIQNLEAALK